MTRQLILLLRRMDTPSSHTVDNTVLQTLILASALIFFKKCGTKEVFQPVLESLEGNTVKECSDKILINKF